MKQITVKVPDGKDAVWQKVENVGQVLMLIDETNDAKIDDRPATERIKTFEDAYNALGEVNPLCKHYDNMRYLEDERQSTHAGGAAITRTYRQASAPLLCMQCYRAFILES